MPKLRVVRPEAAVVPASASDAERVSIELLAAILSELVVMNARLLDLMDERFRR